MQSGKSSLICTILRLLEIDSGTLLLDGLDIATIPREIIRERLIVVPQDPVILAGSLRLNLDPHAHSADAVLKSALERVGLADLAKRIALDDEMSASSLSRGEQQLLALATALVKKELGGKILLLDEATSNLDGDGDAAVQKLLREEFTGCTTIVVAHRLDTILDSDIIAVMDEGTIVEVGKPEVLLGRNGWFTRLANDGGQI
jgi:ABC-type multidrug transport system fused ATPase/permease subunit